MNRSPAARELWQVLYPELTAERPGIYGAGVGRGEAQTLRLSMVYALLDGSSVIDVNYLQAPVAVWRYCDDSARIIFTTDDDGAGDPLERILLVKIKEEPAINRRGLHRAIGGHITAKDMVKALASLRDRGEAYCEMMATGGRPSECWFPDAAPKPIPTTVATPPAVAESPAVASAFAEAIPSQTAETSALTLPGLFEAVIGIGGKLRNGGSGCVVDAPANCITPDITAAVAQLQEALLAILSPPSPVINQAEPDPDDLEMTAVEFFGELDKMLVR